MRRSTNRFRRGQSTTPPITDRILSLLGKGAGGGVQALFLARSSDVALVGSKVATWSDASGLGRHATQAVDATRLTWNATGINGHPSLTSTATTMMATAAIDLTSFERISISVIIKVTGGTSVGIYADFADIGNGMCRCFSDANTRMSAFGKAAAGNAETRSAVSYPMTTAGLLRASVDYTLTTQSTRIWLNTNDISLSFGADPDVSAQAVANGVLRIANRADAALGLQGEIAAVMLCAWPTATAFPGALRQAERELMDEWSIA